MSRIFVGMMLLACLLVCMSCAKKEPFKPPVNLSPDKTAGTAQTTPPEPAKPEPSPEEKWLMEKCGSCHTPDKMPATVETMKAMDQAQFEAAMKDANHSSMNLPPEEFTKLMDFFKAWKEKLAAKTEATPQATEGGETPPPAGTPPGGG